MAMKVLLIERLSEAQRGRVQAAAPEARVVQLPTRDWLLEEIADTEVVLGSVSREAYGRAQRLRWVQVLSAGVDGHLWPEFVESDVILTSAKGYVGTHLAEQAFALLLALTRGIARAVREPVWDHRQAIRDASWELTDRTMGIVGLGGTGVEVARRAAAFGMRVLAVDPEPLPRPDFVTELWPMDRFRDLLAESDVVAICAPLTPATRGIFDREAFQRMRRHAILINVTRGKIVDEAALLEALQTGLIGGAGLDVTPQEPLPTDHPLWRLPNVVVTPHVAGGSPLRLNRGVDLFCQNLRRYVAGQPLLSVIDKRKGY